jgi:hypothetical protein
MLAWAFAFGCGGDAPATEPPPMMWTFQCDDPARFVAQTCGAEDCHEWGNPNGVVDLNSDGVAARVLDQPPKDCAGYLLVDTAHPERSLLLSKLEPMPVCGAPMPFMRPALSPEEKACVLRFVDDLLASHNALDASSPDASN